MSDYVWQPVDEPIGPVELEIEYYTHGDGDTATHYDAGHLGDEWISLGGEIVTTISWGIHGDVRLCRRVPAPPQGVPVEALNRITAWVADWCNGNDDGFDDLAADVIDVRTWLRSLAPAQGQEEQLSEK